MDLSLTYVKVKSEGKVNYFEIVLRSFISFTENRDNSNHCIASFHFCIQTQEQPYILYRYDI